MTSSVEHAESATSTTMDLPSAIRHALASSPEPMTVSKIRTALPTSLRQTGVEELSRILHEETAANRLYEYPKYRSQQERFWDRPMGEHIAQLLRDALEDKPLPWSELRRKLPVYAQDQAQAVLEEQVRQGRLHRHPRHPGSRAGEPYGIRAADAKDYLRFELSGVFNRLERLGFSQAQTRAGALDILHDEEWAPAPPETPSRKEPAQAASTSSESLAAHQPGEAAAPTAATPQAAGAAPVSNPNP